MAGLTALVFAGAGLSPTPCLLARLRRVERPYVVAADSGASTALAFGFRPDLVIGDLDSIDANTLAALRAADVPVEPFPADKDFSDGQLAVERALETDPEKLLLLGFLGGRRLDHSVANVLLLALLPAHCVLLDERNECQLLRGSERLAWDPEPGEIVSLLPIGGDAVGVETGGLRWRLAGDTLRLGETRGLSTEPVAPRVEVRLRDGLLLVLRHFAETLS